MNIAFLTASASRLAAGLLPAVSSLARELTRHSDARVAVLALRDRFTEQDRSAWEGVSLRSFPRIGPASFGYSPALQNALLNGDYDVVHNHGIWMFPSCAAIRWHAVTRRPTLVTPQGMLDPWALSNAAWKKRLAGWLYQNSELRAAACLHAVCEAEARAIRAYGLKNPICVIPNGIDLPASLDAPPPDWEDSGTRGAKVLLYLGRLHPKKNLLNLLRAWAAVQRQGKAARDWRLVIAGWDQNGYHARLARAARDLEIEDSVRFPGPQFGASKHATLGRADAFILPSLSEGIPLAVLEAWAYRVPVLMTPECNLPEGFAAGAAIRLGPAPESIIPGLLELMEMSDAARAGMGRLGRQLVREKFAWPRIARQMRAVYEWCLGGGPRPDCFFQE